MKSILNRDFKYTPSADTDIRKLFKRVRHEQATAKIRTEQAAKNVAHLKPVTK